MKAFLRSRRAYTLVEMMVTLSVFGIAGGMIFELLSIGMNLYNKNISVNVSHQQAREAMDRIVKDVHAAISFPTLVDTSLNPTNSYDWAPGLTFLKQAGSPMKVNKDAAAGQRVVYITTGSYVPVAGQRLVIPTYQIESDISSVSLFSAGVYALTLASNLSAPITVSSGSLNVVAYVADVVSYAVNNGNLLYYNSPTATGIIVARNISSDSPFSVPTD